jgi:16S rRNA (cytidine1402-2'-O)-methyltransferase
LEELLSRNEAFIIYESPFRILKTLAELAELDGERKLILGREMTKKFEEFLQGSASQVMEMLLAKPSIKGEFALLVAPLQAQDSDDHTEEA